MNSREDIDFKLGKSMRAQMILVYSLKQGFKNGLFFMGFDMWSRLNPDTLESRSRIGASPVV